MSFAGSARWPSAQDHAMLLRRASTLADLAIAATGSPVVIGNGGFDNLRKRVCCFERFPYIYVCPEPVMGK